MLRTLILSVLIIVMTAGASTLLWKLRKKPPVIKVPALVTPVKVMEAKRSTQSVEIGSHGVLEAKTTTTAASQVSGKVIDVSPAFEAGGTFREGDLLLKIDPADYETAIAQARSSVADARLQLEMEKAKVDQSLRDWKKLGRNEAPGLLVKREPQLASAQARLEAAEASREKAERDLTRTELRAPYHGRILRTHTDFGSFVSMGSPLADFYEAEMLEVRLPVSLDDLPFINADPIGTKVKLTTSTTTKEWDAQIVRQDSEIDRKTLSLHLIAALEPKNVAEDSLLVPGLFVRATIEGEALNDVFVIPRKALEGENELLVAVPDDTPKNDPDYVSDYRMNKRTVTVSRRDAESVYVSEGLEDGDQVCVSFVPNYTEGMNVKLTED